MVCVGREEGVWCVGGGRRECGVCGVRGKVWCAGEGMYSVLGRGGEGGRKSVVCGGREEGVWCVWGERRECGVCGERGGSVVCVG